VPDMECAICRSTLEREESWNGDISFNCPLCQVSKMTSHKEKEMPILGMPRGFSTLWTELFNLTEDGDD